MPSCDCMTEDPGDGYGERVMTHSSTCREHPEYDERWEQVNFHFNRADELSKMTRQSVYRGARNVPVREHMRERAAHHTNEAIRLREEITGESEDA